MGSNHMHDHFRRIYETEKNEKPNIPTHDPQTGEINPYYEELTGEKLLGEKLSTPSINSIIETDMDKLNRFLINIGNDEKIGIRRKIVIIKKFLDVLGDKED